MEGRRGAAAVMESASGGILAMVSRPDFDPNVFVSSGGDAEVRRIMASSD